MRGFKTTVPLCHIAILAAAAIWLQHRLLAAAETDDAIQIKRWQALYRKRAEALEVAEQRKEGPQKLTLVRNPLQALSNSVRPDQVHGTVHLWTADGRPRMIGSVWSALDQNNRAQRNLCYEFHSLSEFPLTASLNNNVLWRPKDAGIEWLSIKDSPVPAKTRPLRLTQMRQQMAEIRAELDTQESELRLLPQPVYRYPENMDGVIDGAIFSYVMGTDPEVFVLLEVRMPTVGTEPTWLLAPVRFTGSGITLKRGDMVLWKSPVWENFARDKIYDFLYGVEHLEAEQPAVDEAKK